MTKKQKDKSRFDDLFSVAREKPADSENESDSKPTRKSKSTDPNYIRTTVYLPKRMHQQLKAAAAFEDKEMSAIVEQLIDSWLKERQSSS